MKATLHIAAAVILTALVAVPAAAQSDRTSSKQGDSNAGPYFEIVVPQGRMIVRLYDETPVHRDNFAKLASDGFFDGTTFHRVIEGFMIQGGDPNSRDDDPANDGEGDPGYTLPAEIVRDYFHKRGALAAARTGDVMNPERRSSGSQFYIVQGSTFDDRTLDMVEQQVRMTMRDTAFAFSDEARAVYREVGGAPNLDAQYSVFGEVVEGFDVLDAVAAVATPRKTGRGGSSRLTDRPFDDVPMTVRPLPEYTPTAN